MTSIVDKIVELHRALAEAEIPHAFGGALALAWCTEQARGTVDIDVNLFVDASQSDVVIAALPATVEVTEIGLQQIKRVGQTRLWWQKTPLDLFFNTAPFHEDAARRSRIEAFAGEQVPFLACRDIAVFKAFFDRDKDWVDLGEMANAGTLDFEAVLGVITLYLGGDDHRVARLRAMAIEAAG
jgi:hypothetical protein